jgi:inner membrane transporter RhtA
MFGGALSNQVGAATGALAFGVIGPAGVVAIRQWIAGIVLLAAGRPRWRAFTGAQWRPMLLLAVAYGTMNLSLYTAIGRLGLGLAVTLEFLGPLASRWRRAAGGPRLRAGGKRGRGRADPPAAEAPTISVSAWAYWRRDAGPASSCSTEIGAACPGPRAGGEPRRCPRWSSCKPGSWCCSGTRRPRPRAGVRDGARILSSAVPLLADLLALRGFR